MNRKCYYFFDRLYVYDLLYPFDPPECPGFAPSLKIQDLNTICARVLFQYTKKTKK